MTSHTPGPLASRRHSTASIRPAGAIAARLDPFRISGANPEFFSGLAVAVPLALGLWLGMAGMVSLLF